MGSRHQLDTSPAPRADGTPVYQLVMWWGYSMHITTTVVPDAELKLKWEVIE
jgi:hypothetical protein